MKVKFLISLGLLISTLLLVACTSANPDENALTPTAPATATQAAPTATTAATATVPPTNTPAPTEVVITITQPVGTPIPDEVAVKQVAAALAASLNITSTNTTTETTGITGTLAFKLATEKAGPVFWLAYTVGGRNFEAEQNHVLAIYTQSADHWQEIARQELNGDGSADSGASPDYLGAGSVQQVPLEPTHLWIQLEGGAGAHSGVYALFSFDGKTLKAEATSFSSSPGVGSLKDLDGDGIQEVVLDATEYYVFCYACGVRQVQYNILRWDGAHLVPVTLTSLPDSAPAALRERNEHLITLAQAGLWKDALAVLDQAADQKIDDPIFKWNAAFIRLNAEAKRDTTGAPDDQYPLLSYLFYGDFAAAVDVMRKHEVADLFRPDSSLIVGTVAEGNEDALADYITGSTDPAPGAAQSCTGLFPAWWAAYRKDPNAASALADIQQAATLIPTDTLYSQSVTYLNENAGQPTDAQATEVATVLAASLGITNTSAVTNTPGIEGVHAFKLDTGEGGQPLWLAHTYGLHSFDPPQNHVLAIYTPGGANWQEVTRLELKAPGDNANNDYPAPDYLSVGSLQQVKLEPGHIWLQMDGGVGAHSGVFGLFSFDGSALKVEASSFNSSPGAGSLKDLNGDGIQEVLLNATDYYIFCYACGVRNVAYNVLRWDETKLISVTLTTLPESAPPALRELNDSAIALAQAGLWKEALATVEKALALKINDATFAWNAAYIRLNAEAKRAGAENAEDPYPILSHLFYGDFAAAVDVMRKTPPEQIFSANSPLITGTVAAGFEDALVDTITKTVESAIKVRPNLAAAYFLRGWAQYVAKDKAAALADVQHAAQLAPEDKFFAASVAYVSKAP